MGQLTRGNRVPALYQAQASAGLSRGWEMVGYGYGGLGPRFRGDDGLGVRTSFEIVSNTTAADGRSRCWLFLKSQRLEKASVDDLNGTKLNLSSKLPSRC